MPPPLRVADVWKAALTTCVPEFLGVIGNIDRRCRRSRERHRSCFFCGKKKLSSRRRKLQLLRKNIWQQFSVAVEEWLFYARYLIRFSLQNWQLRPKAENFSFLNSRVNHDFFSLASGYSQSQRSHNSGLLLLGLTGCLTRTPEDFPLYHTCTPNYEQKRTGYSLFAHSSIQFWTDLCWRYTTIWTYLLRLWLLMNFSGKTLFHFITFHSNVVEDWVALLEL
jgi:hypothetical protein